MEIGNGIRIIREASGLRQGDLAVKCGLSAAMLSAIESGKREPSISVVASIEDALEIPRATLVLVAQGDGVIGLRSDDSRVESMVASLFAMEECERKLRKLLKEVRKDSDTGKWTEKGGSKK